MAERPLCQRDGCRIRVNRADAKFCSPYCASAKTSLGTGLVVQGNDAVLTQRVEEEVHTLDQLIKVCGIDTSVWTVERYLCGKWARHFQVKAWLKRKVDVIAAKSEVAELIAYAKKSITANVPNRIYKTQGKSLLEIAMPDLHAGKLAWGKETGHQNYDSKIAEHDFDTALEALIQRTAGHEISQVLFVVGNDLLHADTLTGTTTSGTQLDTDVRFHKTFAMVRTMIIRAIQRLKAIAPVQVVMVPGNHDALSVWHLGDSLECYFHNDGCVVIDNTPTQRKYIQHGKVMLMFTHGHKGKKDDYPAVMAAEQKVMWGATTFREAHTGHLHKAELNEYHGAKVRISPALCPPDAWHSEHQFVGNHRSAEAFVWHPEEGLIASAFYTVPLEKAA